MSYSGRGPRRRWCRCSACRASCGVRRGIGSGSSDRDSRKVGSVERDHESWVMGPVSLEEILDRDGWRCQLCGVSIARGVKASHVLAATVDHVIPRSQGGLDDPENLRAAHRGCNAARSVSDDWTPSSRATRGGGITIDLLALVVSKNPALAERLDRFRVREGTDPVEVPIPDLTPEEVGDVFESVKQLAEDYVAAMATLDQLAPIIGDRLKKGVDPEDMVSDLTGDLLDWLDDRLSDQIPRDIPLAAGLGPVWGFKPFMSHQWGELGQVFVQAIHAWDRIDDAVLDVNLGESSAYIESIKADRLEGRAVAAKKAGNEFEAERLWLEVMEIGERPEMLAYHRRDHPTSKPYREIATIRSKRDDKAGRIETLQRFADQIPPGAVVSKTSQNVLDALTKLTAKGITATGEPGADGRE